MASTLTEPTFEEDVLLPSKRREMTSWRVCAWGGPSFIVAFLCTWAGIAGFLPPPSADWGAERMAQYYSDNSVRIRIGMGLGFFVTYSYVIWSMGVARVMKRMEGTTESPLTRLQVYGGLGTSIGCIIFSLLWTIPAFEAANRDFDPRTIQVFNDAGWIAFDLIGVPAMVQMTTFSLVILGRRDPGAPQLVPRWMGYLGIFTTLTFFEVLCLLFFTSGPFAYDGAVTYYVLLAIFFVWMSLACHYVIRGVKVLEAEEETIAAAALA